jgi:hypothetical protein
MADSVIFEEEEGIDADDLIEGFGEEEEILEDEDVVVLEDGVSEIDAVEGGEEVPGAGDSEADLADVLATTIWKVATKGEAIDDEVTGPEVLPDPRQKDEFRCSSCRLLKKNTQLANPAKELCKDCV